MTQEDIPTQPGVIKPDSSPLAPHQLYNGGWDEARKQKRLYLASGLLIMVALIGALVSLSHHQANSTAIIAVSHPKVSVQITDSGFFPATMLVKAGAEVTWVNNSSSSYVIASNPYPSHTSLPSLASNTIPPHGSYSYIFAKTGQWGYQDNLNPLINGTIKVSP